MLPRRGHLFPDHVGRRVAVETGDGNDEHLVGRCLSRDDRLQSDHNLTSDVHRIDGPVRHAAVASASADSQAEEVPAGEHGPGHRQHGPEGSRSVDVRPEHAADADHGSLGDHPLCAGKQFLGGLEAEPDGAAEFNA